MLSDFGDEESNLYKGGSTFDMEDSIPLQIYRGIYTKGSPFLFLTEETKHL